MEKNDEVLTDVRIAKYIANSSEPIVIETKTTTTTTTTTVTKRICLPKDADVNPTEIKSLLNGDSPGTANLSCIEPPNAEVTTHKNTNENDKNAVKIIDAPKSPVNHEPNQSLLSSTKIENLTDSPKVNHYDNLCNENDLPRSNLLSPNLSKIANAIPLQNKDKIVRDNKNLNTFRKPKPKTNVKTIEKMAKEKGAPAPTEKRTTRSTMVSDNLTRGKTTGKENYIDSLINQYIELDKKPPRRKKSPKQPKIQKPPERPKTPVMELKDLSAIFENSAEGEASPLSEKPSNVSPIESDGGNNHDCSMGAVDFPSPTKMQASDASELPGNSPLKEIINKKGTKRTSLSVTKGKTKAKKPRKDAKAIETSVMKLIKNESIGSNNSNCTNSPIKIYSPSNRGKLRSKADRLTLTKKMVEKKLQNHLNSSKCILARFDRTKALTVDAKFRLVVYNPNGNENENENENQDETVTDGDVDILSVLARRKRPILVKEIDEQGIK